MSRSTFREALLLVAVAVAFGFAYTLLTKQGFFAEQKPGQDQPASLEMISFERAKTLFTADSALFIDSRHAFDYRIGHIRGSKNIALAEFDKDSVRLGGIPKNRSLVVYCDGAQCTSSLELAVKLTEMGFTNVQIFFGGWQEWKSNGMPIDTVA
jgi:rhodanese-related sulfurtransferase